MITPSFGLTATERILPRLALDFTTASLDSRVTLTRAGNTATVTNSSGVIAVINANLPRFDYDPTTLICKGLLVEESRTNLLVNSLLNGTSLSTQLVTTTAVAHTLSFYGTGQIVLTGTSSATVVGTGAYPARQTLTFTPTVGVLTLTVTGTVQYAQLEVGSFVTSFIPTDATSKTRNADVAAITGTNFSSWFNASEGAFQIRASTPQNYSTGFQSFFTLSDGTSANRISAVVNAAADIVNTEMIVASSVTAGFYLGYTTGNTSIIFGYKLNNANYGKDGLSGTTNTSCAIPTLNQVSLGSSFSTNFLNGYVQKVFYFPQRIINAELAAFSK